VNELALFAGAGGGILGGSLLGWRTLAAVEINPFCRRVLLARQRDGCLPEFPIWDDVSTFDGRPWRGYIDIITGGFPCQDISTAGAGAGISGKRSGLWSEMARICSEIMPRFIYVENSPMLTGRGLDRVLMDMAAMGYDARWGMLSAADTGALHKRKRIWVLANTNGLRKPQQEGREQVFGRRLGDSGSEECGSRWPPEPSVGRMAHGVADRVDRLKALGNGQVPRVAASAFLMLKK
tara:strand:+ start:24459 stop:25169 length:711 start_codon:yes stop_codon:yes gene_type:complete